MVLAISATREDSCYRAGGPFVCQFSDVNEEYESTVAEATIYRNIGDSCFDLVIERQWNYFRIVPLAGWIKTMDVFVEKQRAGEGMFAGITGVFFVKSSILLNMGQLHR